MSVKYRIYIRYSVAMVMACFFSCLFLISFVLAAPDNPKLANYYLGELKRTKAFVDDISRYDLLILTPTQIKLQRDVVGTIKNRNPNIVILAYVPMQSYNDQFWDKSYSVYRGVKVRPSWWLRDSRGSIIHGWPGISNINLDPSWSNYFVDYVDERILSLDHVDGIFFDIVSENISWINGGDVDMNNDGRRDTPSIADKLWLERTEYFLRRAREHFSKDTRIVINGSSHESLQPYINGRMFENFPTPWEGNGEWNTIMNNLNRIQGDHQKQKTSIINSNTANTGNRRDYKEVRFGLTSSLLEDDVYFSFDFGDKNHGQLWWYDEYDVDLGAPLGASYNTRDASSYNASVWKRDFVNGISIVNSGSDTKRIDLGGEFEHIHGIQDKAVNDGSVVSHITLAPQDGRILLKTFETFSGTPFVNGSFARFFRPEGERVRNGFFVVDTKEEGGTTVLEKDMNGNGKPERIVSFRGKIFGWRDDGKRLFEFYPYGSQYTGALHIAVGDFLGNSRAELVVAPSNAYPAPVKIFTRNGTERHAFYPFGEGYSGGYSVALGNVRGGAHNELMVGAGSGISPRVLIYDRDFVKQHDWLAFESSFRGGISIASGNIDGKGFDDIVVGAGPGKKPYVRTFVATGAQLYDQFVAYSSIHTPGVDVGVVDIDFDGVDDIITFSQGI